MNIQIKSHDVSISQAVTDYINKRIGPLEKFLGEHQAEAIAYVRVGRTNEHHKTGEDVYEIEIAIESGAMRVRAEAGDADLYASIDKVRDEAMRELTSGKDKRVSLLRRGGQRIKNMMRGLYK